MIRSGSEVRPRESLQTPFERAFIWLDLPDFSSFFPFQFNSKTFGPKKGKRASLEMIKSHEEVMTIAKGVDAKAEVMAEKQVAGGD